LDREQQVVVSILERLKHSFLKRASLQEVVTRDLHEKRCMELCFS
jgi:hypothetical protein